MYLEVKIRLSNKFWARHLVDTRLHRPVQNSRTPRMQSPAPAAAEYESGKRPRLGDQPLDAGRLVLKVGELLIPMVAAMRRGLINGSYIQADETPVGVQMHAEGVALRLLPSDSVNAFPSTLFLYCDCESDLSSDDARNPVPAPALAQLRLQLLPDGPDSACNPDNAPCLRRDMAEQELNLFQFAAACVAQLGAVRRRSCGAACSSPKLRQYLFTTCQTRISLMPSPP
jgi:hypothetical protein